MSTADAKPLGSAEGTAAPNVGGQTVKGSAGGKRPSGGRAWWKPVLFVLCILALAGAGGWYWWQQHLQALPPSIAKANGRLESEQVEIAAKYAGRIAEVFAIEGQMVNTGDLLARMDTVELEAQLAEAKAKVIQAEQEKKQAEALIAQRESERTFAKKELFRAETLHKEGWATGEKLDEREDRLRTAEAAYDTAIAGRNAAEAKIAAASADVARIQSQIDDSTLVAPRPGRIQYKLAQPGEVLSSGGRVLTLLDLSDVYLTIFLPARQAAALAIGDEARVVLDVVPEHVFPATITFVATEAQFTPKTVETSEEREKLMFRVKLTIDPKLRQRYQNQVKTGLRGVGFVRTDPSAPWPPNLAVKLP